MEYKIAEKAEQLNRRISIKIFSLEKFIIMKKKTRIYNQMIHINFT